MTELERWWDEYPFLIIGNQHTSSCLPLTSCTSWFLSSLPVMRLSFVAGRRRTAQFYSATSTQNDYRLEYVFFFFAAVRRSLEWNNFSISVLYLPNTSEESKCVNADKKKGFSPSFLLTFLLSYWLICSSLLLLSFLILHRLPSSPLSFFPVLILPSYHVTSQLCPPPPSLLTPSPPSLEAWARSPVWKHLPSNLGEGG